MSPLKTARGADGMFVPTLTSASTTGRRSEGKQENSWGSQAAEEHGPLTTDTQTYGWATAVHQAQIMMDVAACY